ARCPSREAPRRGPSRRHLQALEGAAELRWDLHRPAGPAIDEHVHEPALRERARLSLAAQLELVAHARAAQLSHAQPHVDPVREGDAALVLAMRLGAYADHLALVDVEAALVDQPCIDGGVEERVVLDV